VTISHKIPVVHASDSHDWIAKDKNGDKIFFNNITSVSDPDSIRSLSAYPYSESRSGSRRAKMTNKIEKKLRN
jgi:hypothetical protein